VYELRQVMDLARERRVQLECFGQLQFDICDLLLLCAEVAKRGLEFSLRVVGRCPHEEADIQLSDSRYEAEWEVEACRSKPRGQPRAAGNVMVAKGEEKRPRGQPRRLCSGESPCRS